MRILINILVTITLNWSMNPGRLKMSYTKWGLFIKSKFTKCRKVIPCGLWLGFIKISIECGNNYGLTVYYSWIYLIMSVKWLMKLTNLQRTCILLSFRRSCQSTVGAIWFADWQGEEEGQRAFTGIPQISAVPRLQAT